MGEQTLYFFLLLLPLPCSSSYHNHYQVWEEGHVLLIMHLNTVLVTWYVAVHFLLLNQRNCGIPEPDLKCFPRGVSLRSLVKAAVSRGVCAPQEGRWVLMGSAVVSESPRYAGQQDLVLPRGALTHGSASTEQRLKLWACCPSCTFCQ